MNLKIKRLTSTATMPTKAHLTDAGLDDTDRGDGGFGSTGR